MRISNPTTNSQRNIITYITHQHIIAIVVIYHLFFPSCLATLQCTNIVFLQEPDVFGVRWEAANGKPGYADLCIRLMDAAYSIVPGALLFVEGTGQSGLAYNWGERHAP